MCKKTYFSPIAILMRCLMLLGLLGGMLIGSNVQAFTLNVVDDNGNAISGYQWTVQEDNTWDAVANVGKHNVYDTLSTSIHKSHAHVLAAGSSSTVNVPNTGRYFISALAPGYTLNGAMVKPGQTNVTVVLHANPIPMGQVSVLVFEDNAPINGAPDVTSERALPNFKIYVYDQLGQMSTDGFGNPIGTTYDLASGAVLTIGAGYVLTTSTGDDTTGNAIIPNLAPGKYGIRAVPNDGRPWIQTSTIEGTPGIDVWIMAGEPPYLTEAGFFGVHAFIGFVLPTSYYQSIGDTTTNQFRALLPGETAGTITGQQVINRQNRPPLQLGLVPGDPVPEAYVGLSDMGNGNTQVYVAKCDANANFNITGVPPGTYTLTLWDFPLMMSSTHALSSFHPPAGLSRWARSRYSGGSVTTTGASSTISIKTASVTPVKQASLIR
jgi:large repetitive protein